MNHRWLIVAGIVVLIGILAWFTLLPDGPTDPDGGTRDRPDDVDVGPGRNGEIPVAEPFRGQPAVDALREGPTGRAKLADLARSKKGVEQILAALGATESAGDRARLQLHLILGKTKEGRDAVFRNARGEGEKRDRLPAILALAGGDEAAVTLLAGFLAAEEVDEVVLTAAHALALRADDRAFLALEAAVLGTEAAEPRILLYAALQNSPVSGLPGAPFLALLRESGGVTGLSGTDTTAGPYRRLVDRITAESDGRALRTAMDLLLHLPGPDTKGGVVTLWRRSEGEERRELTEFAIAGLEPNEPGAAAGLVTIAREATGDERERFREQVLQRIQECRERDALPILREWAENEEDEAFREQIREQVRRIEEEG